MNLMVLTPHDDFEKMLKLAGTPCHKCGEPLELWEEHGVRAIRCNRCNIIYSGCVNKPHEDTIICLVGPSGVGKTAVAYELQKQHGFNVIESYTTRPPRYKGEKGHIFVDHPPDLSNDVIAHNVYNGYHYWATRQQYQGKGISIYVVDVPGIVMLRERVRDAGIVVIAMFADHGTRKHRLIHRDMHGSYTEYVERERKAWERLQYDAEAFSIIPCDYVVDANPDLDTVVERVASILRDCSHD